MTFLSLHLKMLRLDAGQPSTRMLASRAGVSHSSVAAVLNGTYVPSWKMAEKITLALLPEGQSSTHAKNLWKMDVMLVEKIPSNERIQGNRAMHSYPIWAQEESCRCGRPAAHKVMETSGPTRLHPLTAYACCEHFRMLVGDCSRYPYDGNPH